MNTIARKRQQRIENLKTRLQRRRERIESIHEEIRGAIALIGKYEEFIREDEKELDTLQAEGFTVVVAHRPGGTVTPYLIVSDGTAA